MTSKSTLIALIYLVGGALAAFVIDKALTSGFAAWNVANTAILGDNFTLSTLIAVAVGAAVAGYAWIDKRSKKFTNEVIDETSKVAWPEWSETRVSTLVVIAFSFISAGILGVFDAVFSYLTNNNLFLY